MTTDLMMLVWSAVLCIALIMPYAGAKSQRLGLATLAGNREGVPPSTGWVGRAERAHANMIENLIPFAIFVLVVAVTGKANLMSALGAQVFFWARVAHAVLYIAGIPWARTLAWVISLVGMGLVVSALFQG